MTKINNTHPVKEETGFMALVVGKPIEMVLGVMLTIIMGLVSLIYHDGHTALLTVSGRLDKIEVRMDSVEKATLHTTDRVDAICQLMQYGLIPKPLREEKTKQ